MQTQKYMCNSVTAATDVTSENLQKLTMSIEMHLLIIKIYFRAIKQSVTPKQLVYWLLLLKANIK